MFRAGGARVALTLALCFALYACARSGDPPTPPPPPYQPLGPDGNVVGETAFAELLRRYSQGRATRTPWVGYWWPFSEGGISEAAERYEHAFGISGVKNWELTHHGQGASGFQSWWGHCNGWAAAAALLPEPRDSVNVAGTTFGVSEQKQLLSEIAMETRSDFFGTRDDTDDPTSPSFQDIFPDQFFLVLTNLAGAGGPLIIDRYTGSQVWNQPVAGYRISPVTANDDLGVDPSAPDVHRVRVTIQLWWARDDVAADAVTEPFEFADGQSYRSRSYRAEIWLDAPARFDSAGNLAGAGNVIVTRNSSTAAGGAWTNSDADLMETHPDYAWVPLDLQPSTGFANPELDANWIRTHF
jgi:hypothetical protein